MNHDINTILRNDSRSSPRGAPMGRSNVVVELDQLQLQRVNLVDGDYSEDGTYWGGGPGNNNLWCAFKPDGETKIFVRGNTRALAIKAVRDDYPNVTFAPPEFDLEAFIRGYAKAALWSSTDSDEEYLDENHDTDDIAESCMAKMREDCLGFIQAQLVDLKAYVLFDTRDEACAGHDFWLTRNGHGAGFWDRGMGQLGERLSKASGVYSSVDLYVGDDGKIHC